MEKINSNLITDKSQELYNYVSTLDKSKFVPLFIFLLKADRETSNHFLRLTSKIQQIFYILKLFLGNTKGINSDIDFPKVENLLEEIEQGYKNRYDITQIESYYDESYRKSLAISGSFLNYFTNSTLVYTEQILDRIKGTFTNQETLIKKETGLSINDYIDLFFAIKTTAKNKFIETHEKFSSEHVNKSKDGIICWSEKGNLFLPYSLTQEISFQRNDVNYEVKEKLSKFLTHFSSKIGDTNNIYYCTQNPLWSKPIITLDNYNFYLPFDPQLAIAIYYFLLTVCESKNTNIASKSRSNYLETKSQKLFDSYFRDTKYKLYSNYYINKNDNEKDLLILSGDLALIIECKSNKYKEPLGDFEPAFDKIKRDFKMSIQDGYRQCKEVEDAIWDKDIIEITDKNKNIIESISTKKIKKVYSIIITQERFGQIQCDLGLLLDKNESDLYPWCVSIDDLETILLTFSRKENKKGTLEQYLFQREKLHERVICFDELDIAGYYLLKYKDFIKACNSDQLFMTSPDMCEFFDSLYRSGFGFENEIDLDQKFDLSISSVITYAMCKKIKLQTPKLIAEYKKANGINDAFLKHVEKILTHHPDSEETKEFVKLLGNKSIPLQEFISTL